MSDTLIVPTWALSELHHIPHPQPDEAFSSWIVRAAAAHGWTPNETAYRLGIAPSSQAVDMPTAVDIALDSNALRTLEARTGFAAADLATMTMTGHRTALFPDVDRSGNQWTASFGRMTFGWISNRPICPACIAENNGAQALRWHSAFLAGCTRHGLVLNATCSACSHIHGRHGAATKTWVRGGTAQADPFRCPGPFTPRGTGERPTSRGCGTRLDQELATPLTPNERDTLDAITTIVNAGEGIILGEPCDAHEALHDIRSMIGLLRSVANAPLLATLEGERAAALANDLGERAARRERGQLSNVTIASPSDPLTAVLLVTAVNDILQLNNPDLDRGEVVATVGELIRAASATPGKLKAQLLLSPRIEALMDSVSESKPGRRGNAWTAAQRMDAAATFITAVEEPHTVEKYEQWRASNPTRHLPGTRAMLQHDGKWRGLMEATRQHLGLPPLANAKRRRDPGTAPRPPGDTPIMIACLRDADAANDGVLTAEHYQRWAESDSGRTGLSTVIANFGTWRSACIAADIPTSGPGGQQTWTADAIDDIMRRFIAKCDDAGITPSLTNYNDYRTRQPAPMPSYTAIVRGDRTWQDALDRAQRTPPPPDTTTTTSERTASQPIATLPL